jgi:peptidoglycan/LPS O-acetylase OafA/YrhL
MVTLFHLGFASWASPAYHLPFSLSLIENIAQPGWVGVEVFFVISGFVLANSAQGATGFSFIRGRILRLYPAVWICASLTLLVSLRHGLSGGLLHSYLDSMLLAPIGPWIDGQYWTLATEIAFYALVFLTVISRNIARISVLAHGMAFAGAACIALLYLSPMSHLLGALTTQPFNAVPIFYGCDFAVGIYLWLWSRGNMSAISAGGLMVAVLGGATQIFYSAIQTSTRTAPISGHVFSPIVPITIWLAAIALIGLSVWKSRAVNQLPTGFLRTLRMLGLMTYPLYLLHFAIGLAAMSALTKLHIPAMAALWIVIALLCGLSLGVCQLPEPFIRKRLRSVIDPLWDMRKQAAIAVEAPG